MKTGGTPFLLPIPESTATPVRAAAAGATTPPTAAGLPPGGAGTLGVAVTTALGPHAGALVEDTRAVFVRALQIVGVSVALRAAKFASPPYEAVIVWFATARPEVVKLAV